MTEDARANEAGANLERAIADWAQATYPDDNDLVSGWLLITETVPTEASTGSAVVTASSDDMTLVRQVGLLDYARELALQAVRNTAGGD